MTHRFLKSNIHRILGFQMLDLISQELGTAGASLGSALPCWSGELGGGLACSFPTKPNPPSPSLQKLTSWEQQPPELFPR